MKSIASEQVRNLILRADPGEVLPGALTTELRAQNVACGWIRASGVLTAVEIRAFDAELGGPAVSRRLQGNVQVLVLEGSIGMSGSDVSVGLRAIVARETDRGLETFAGEIVSARVVALEAVVTAFDDVLLARALDKEAGVWLLGATRSQPPVAMSAPPPPPAPARDVPPPRASEPRDFAEAIAASANASSAPKRPAPPMSALNAAVIPPRPVRLERNEEEQLVPEPGAVVDHFAFGRCEVMKTDGDRLHLKMPRDGRVKEIALEMLKVTPLPDEDGRRRYKLERRL